MPDRTSRQRGVDAALVVVCLVWVHLSTLLWFLNYGPTLVAVALAVAIVALFIGLKPWSMNRNLRRRDS